MPMIKVVTKDKIFIIDTDKIDYVECSTWVDYDITYRTITIFINGCTKTITSEGDAEVDNSAVINSILKAMNERV